MKKYIYTLVIILLSYGNSFADSVDLCINPSLRCLDYSFPMNAKSKTHENCARLLLANEVKKTYSITTIYFTSFDAYESPNQVRSQELDAPLLSPINAKFKRLQNLNETDYFAEPISVPYFKGFGLQIRI